MKLDIKEALGTWYPVLHHLFEDERMVNIGKIIGSTSQLQPAVKHVFRAFKECPFDDCRVVILGQDPYPGGEADGIAFSSRYSARPYSLDIIYKELIEEGYGSRRSNDLTDWANQGVLLLNSCLTTPIYKTGGHDDIGWQWFVSEVLRAAMERTDRMVIAAWGKSAKAIMEPFLMTSQLAGKWIMYSPHPAATKHGYKFVGNGHFRRTNEYLISHGLKPIEWNRQTN